MKFSLGRWLLPVYAVLALLFLMVPIVYTFIFSFNDSQKSNITWRGFTLDKWLNVCNVQNGAVCEAFGNSLIIGAVATVAATALGTMIAIAIVRYRFRFRSGVSLLLFLPMATPEVVLGAGGYIIKPHGQVHAMWNAGKTPARMIEIISPPGFENFFRELSDMTATGTFDLSKVRLLGDRYGLPFAQPDWLEDVIARYGLTQPPR